MGCKYRDRYGIPGSEVKNLAKRYYTQQLAEGFYDLDTFLLWCSQNGYKKGLALKKRVETLPHSTENSYFEDYAAHKQERSEKFHADMSISNPLCRECTTECGGTGCAEWQEYFKENWNRNIHVKPAKQVQTVVEEGPMVFRYEHPDLVREGIVWRGN
jgi:hypothetical protein